MKKFVVFVVFVSMFCGAFAQKRNYITSAKTFNSVELSLNGGVHALHLSLGNPIKGLADEISPMLQFSVGYHFSPILGTRLAIRGGNTKNVLSNTLLSNSLIYAHTDLLVNLTNFWKTKAKKKYYDATIVFGVGCATLRPKEIEVQHSTLAINGGIVNSFYLNRNLLLNIELKLMLVNDVIPSNYNFNYGGWSVIYDASLGLSYKIPTN